MSFQAVGDRSLVYPVHFAFGAYRNLYSPANLQLDASRANTVATTPLESGLYCYSIANTVAVPVGANQAERVDLSQSVHLRMSILPSN